MTIELINTGSELLLGRVLNTHQQWICRQLADLGYTVNRQVAVPDGAPDIRGAVREALHRADLVIATGGLGPTSDDRTRELVAEMLGRPLQHDPTVAESIRTYFESRGRPVPARTAVEAQVPAGARVLPNRCGTAPGLALILEPNPFGPAGRRALLILLPGPPRELRPMFLDQVVPLLAEVFSDRDPFVCRTLKTTGLGESHLEERIDGPLQPLLAAGLELGYCARVGEVDVRLVGRGARARELVDAAERLVTGLVAEHLFGWDDDLLETVLVREFTRRGLRLAVAESCTGGHITNRLTNVPGASAVLLAGYVTYANESKTQVLGVRPETLEKHGAVSEAVVREMAEGARRAGGADWALATTGIAGPGGGSAEKPVGTVFIAWAGPAGTTVVRQQNVFDRETFKYLTAQQAMFGLLRRSRSAPV